MKFYSPHGGKASWTVDSRTYGQEMFRFFYGTWRSITVLIKARRNFILSLHSPSVAQELWIILFFFENVTVVYIQTLQLMWFLNTFRIPQHWTEIRFIKYIYHQTFCDHQRIQEKLWLLYFKNSWPPRNFSKLIKMIPSLRIIFTVIVASASGCSKRSPPWGLPILNLHTITVSRPPLWSTGQSSWLQIQRSGFCSRRYRIFWELVDLERGPLSLVSTTEEPLGRKSSGSGLENREYGRRDPSRWPRGTLYPQTLALISLTSGGRSV
jgi:hypothetical protein